MPTSTITGTIRDGSGAAVAGVTVYARLRPGPAARLSDGSSVANPAPTTTNGSGVYTFALEQQANIAPAGSWWEIEEDTSDAAGGRHTWAISVGSQAATVQQSLVTPLGLLGPSALTQAQGDARYIAQGEFWVSVKNAAYGAKGDGVTDDTAAIQAAIDAVDGAGAGGAGGIVYFPPGIYKTTASLTLRDGVILQGAAGPVGWAFGNPSRGSVIKPAAGAYDAIVTPAAQVRGSGLRDIGIDGFTDTSHWLLNVGDSTGFLLENVAIRQSASGANAVWLQGTVSGVYQSSIRGLSINCGGGFVGGTALRYGGNSGASNPANANAGHMVQIIGYATGVDFNNGGGNSILGIWVQACGTAARFNSSRCVLVGGWMEANTASVLTFTSSSTDCEVSGIRNPGQNGAVAVTYAGSGHKIDMEGYSPVRAMAYQTAVHSIPDSTSTTVHLGGIVSSQNDGNFDIATYTYTAPQDGLYRVDGRVEMASACTRLIAQVFVGVTEKKRGSDGAGLAATVSGLLPLAKGNAVTLQVFQTSGGSLNTAAAGVYSTFLDIALVA